MKRLILLILLFGILGLIFGYILFGKMGGEYINLKFLFQSAANPIESFGRKIAGIEKIRQNIIISGVAGGILGVILYYIRKK
ncbi:MAG: hypothetical protein R6V23_12765 [Bacteroidales bacterium]